MTDDIKHPLAKFLTALGTLATMDFWTVTGKLAAALLSICMLSEWIWKRLLKPALQRSGRLGGPKRPFLDSTGAAPLDGE